MVLESEGSLAPLDFFDPGITAEQIDAHAHWLKPGYLTDDNRVNMSFVSNGMDAPTLNGIEMCQSGVA